MAIWVMLAAAIVGEPSVYEREAKVYRKLYERELVDAKETLEHVEDARISRRRDPGLDDRGIYWLPNNRVKVRLRYHYREMIARIEKALREGNAIPWHRSPGAEPGQIRFLPQAKFRAMVKGRPVYHSSDGYLWLNDESMQNVQNSHPAEDDWPEELKIGWYHVIREDKEMIGGHAGTLRTVDTRPKVGIQLGVYLKRQ